MKAQVQPQSHKSHWSEEDDSEFVWKLSVSNFAPDTSVEPVCVSQ